MKRLLVPVLLLTCVTAEAAPTQKQLRECLSIDDMTKERLNCYDKLVPPEPKSDDTQGQIGLRMSVYKGGRPTLLRRRKLPQAGV
jgi:hypothetical protein